MKLSEKELSIQMIISTWDTQNARISKLLDTLSDEQLMKETAPGRNRGIYLLGHLTAVSDGMLPILGWGSRIYPELESTFVTQPDKSVATYPAVADLRTYWKKVNAKISEMIATMTTDDWFSKHSLVSAEDFGKEPHRNKLNIFVNRTNHHSYHYGQMVYLGVKK